MTLAYASPAAQMTHAKVAANASHETPPTSRSAAQQIVNVHGQAEITLKATGSTAPQATFNCTDNYNAAFYDQSLGTGALGYWDYGASGSCTIVMANISYLTGVYKNSDTLGYEDHISGSQNNVNINGGSNDYGCTGCQGTWTYHYDVNFTAPAGYVFLSTNSPSCVIGSDPAYMDCYGEFDNLQIP